MSSCPLAMKQLVTLLKNKIEKNCNVMIILVQNFGDLEGKSFSNRLKKTSKISHNSSSNLCTILHYTPNIIYIKETIKKTLYQNLFLFPGSFLSKYHVNFRS